MSNCSSFRERNEEEEKDYKTSTFKKFKKNVQTGRLFNQEESKEVIFDAESQHYINQHSGEQEITMRDLQLSDKYFHSFKEKRSGNILIKIDDIDESDRSINIEQELSNMTSEVIYHLD